MWEFLSALAALVFDQFESIWVLYTGGSILGLSLILWILDRLFHVFDIVKR